MVDLRIHLIDAFLQHGPWQNAERKLLKQDASFRRYWRLSLNQKSCILMDAPPPEKPVSLFADIAKFLSNNGLCAPEILAIDDLNGLMLLQDFGDNTFTRLLLNDPERENELYALAIDTLLKLHQIQLPSSLSLPTYSWDILIDEAALFIDWFYPAVSNKPASTGQIESFKHAWLTCFKQLTDHQNVVVLRDYHVDNLMIVNSSDGNNQCGLLDFQDALMGSPAYDLVSLVEDARRDISPEFKIITLDQYFNATESIDNAPTRANLMPWINVLAAQRHAKVLGIFIRLYKRDGKAHYLKHLPRVMALFNAALEREALLRPIKCWMQENISANDIDIMFTNYG